MCSTGMSGIWYPKNAAQVVNCSGALGKNVYSPRVPASSCFFGSVAWCAERFGWGRWLWLAVGWRGRLGEAGGVFPGPGGGGYSLPRLGARGA
jgi:hypothetical protein